MRKNFPELKLAVDVFIAPEQAGKLKVIREHLIDLESQKAELEQLILTLASPYQQKLNIILTVPCINSIFTAIGIIFEHGDFSFDEALMFVGWSCSNQQ